MKYAMTRRRRGRWVGSRETLIEIIRISFSFWWGQIKTV